MFLLGPKKPTYIDIAPCFLWRVQTLAMFKHSGPTTSSRTVCWGHSNGSFRPFPHDPQGQPDRYYRVSCPENHDVCEIQNRFAINMGVSLNGGTPKSSILIGFFIINHPFWGTPIFGNIHICTDTSPIFYIYRHKGFLWRVNGWGPQPKIAALWTCWLFSLLVYKADYQQYVCM